MNWKNFKHYPAVLGSALTCLVLAFTFVVPMSAQSSIFSIQKTPNPNIQGNTFNAVAAISATDAWAAGYQNDNNLNFSRTLIQHWDGTKWKVVPSPNPGSPPECQDSNSGNVVNALAAIASDDVWAVGFSFKCTTIELQPMILHWDGTKWNVVPGPRTRTNDNSSLNSIVALTSDNIYAVGYQPAPNGAVLTLIEHWDGTAWTQMKGVDRSATGNVLFGVSANSPTDIWAVGVSVDEPTNSIQTLVEHFDGTRWRVVPSPNPLPKAFLNQNTLLSVQAVSANDVTAAGFLGDASNQRQLTFIEHWDGTKWSVIPSPNQSEVAGSLNTLRSVTALSGTDLYAAGFFADAATNGQDETLVEHFDGSNWTIIPSPTKGLAQQLNGVFALPGTTNVWTVGGDARFGIDPESGFLQLPQTLVLFSPIG